MRDLPPSSRPGGTRVFRARLAALAVFLVCLAAAAAWAAAPGKPGAPGKQAQPYILADLPPWGAIATPTPPFDVGWEYVLLGFAGQGMYQSPAPGGGWTLPYPGPTMSAQLFKRGAKPDVVDEGVRLIWEAAPETALEGKDAPRRGEMAPEPGGLTFSADIPVTVRQTNGLLNPYPIIFISAEDAKTGVVLAKTAAVLAVSPGYGCARCHADAGKAVLAAHDKRQALGLVKRSAKEVVDCRSCHSGPAAPEAAPKDGQAPRAMSVSASVHGWHAQFLAGRGGESCVVCHIGIGKSRAEGPDAPARPVFARDLHIERGLRCVTCHGVMEDHSLALLKAEEGGPNARAAKAAMARIKPVAARAEEINARLPWRQEPDCSGCHDLAVKPSLENASGFNKWVANASGLYSRRADDTEKIRCASCHGAQHAIYPAKNPIGRDRDNIAPIQYQEHARSIGAAGNCALCHTQAVGDPAHHPLVKRERQTISLPDGVKTSMPRVGVSHQAHAALDCKACHHTGRVEGKSMACAAAGCHDGATVPAGLAGGSGTPDAGSGKSVEMDYRYFRNAFHGPGNSCFNCHASSQAAGKPAGPTACKDCHMAPSPRWTADLDAVWPDTATESAKQQEATTPETQQ